MFIKMKIKSQAIFAGWKSFFPKMTSHIHGHYGNLKRAGGGKSDLTVMILVDSFGIPLFFKKKPIGYIHPKIDFSSFLIFISLTFLSVFSFRLWAWN